MIAELTDRAVIALSGPEARSYLQGLITNDVEQLAPSNAIYAALLTPQGKILFDFLIAEGDGALLLDCDGAVREALLKRLRMYKLRAKVDIEARDQLAVVAGWDSGAVHGGISFADPRTPLLGMRSIVSRGEMPAGFAAADAYLARRLDHGVPQGADFGSDKMFALDGDLDALHGVSFTKGCYVGQELTARMKHRGTSRKRLLPIATADGSPLPGEGTSIRAGDRDVGEITSTYGARGFALVRMDRWEEAGAAPLAAAERPVILIKPSWLFA